MSAEVCGAEIWDGWHTSYCTRPVKRDGMCGIHAAAKEKVARNRQAAQEKRAAEDAHREALTARLAVHGLEYQARFSAEMVADFLDATKPPGG